MNGGQVPAQRNQLAVRKNGGRLAEMIGQGTESLLKRAAARRVASVDVHPITRPSGVVEAHGQHILLEIGQLSEQYQLALAARRVHFVVDHRGHRPLVVLVA
ncbi:hypothetical protein D3C85_1482350 [compost metagenome]